MGYRSFEELEVWKLGCRLAVRIKLEQRPIILFARPHMFIDGHFIGPYNISKFMATFMGLQEGDMLQAKFSCKEDQVTFLNSYKDYGFKDKSAMMREALNLLRKERDLQKLRQSADLYAETYDEDSELKELTATATHGWPE